MKKQPFPPGRKYGFADFITIPFLAAPVSTTLLLVNSLITALLPSYQVFATASFVDTATGIFGGSFERAAIIKPLLMLFAITLFYGLDTAFLAFVNASRGKKLDLYIRPQIEKKRAQLEYKHIENNETWELINRVRGDITGRIKGGYDILTGSASLILRVVSILAVFTVQVWWAGLAVLAITVPLFALAIKAGKASYQANVEAQKHTRRANYLSETLMRREYSEERSLFGYSEGVNEEWYEKYETARKINLKTGLKYFIRMKSSSLITIGVSVLIILFLIIPLASGEISSGMFIALVTATFDLVQLMSWSLSYNMQQLAYNREYLADLTKFAALSETEGACDLPAANPPEFESAEFRNVSFKYPGTDKLILDNFSLKMEKGRHYAFVGVNGAGKTTITKLLTGLYDDYDGEILVNGINIKTLPFSVLKSIFSVVYQDFAKYNVTLADNIALGDVNLEDESRTDRAIEEIGLSSAVEKLPNGKNTFLGKAHKDGVDLSGGEWQRVAIARSLYSRAPVRILDEPTAALDPVAESEVYGLFGRISKGQTTVFITHRLGAARLADEIIVLDGGHVAEKGSHGELIAESRLYAEMFDAQKQWYSKEAV